MTFDEVWGQIKNQMAEDLSVKHLIHSDQVKMLLLSIYNAGVRQGKKEALDMIGKN